MSDPGSAVKQALQALKDRAEPIAIVGMGCRFPGCESVDAFWRMLCEGGDAIAEAPADRWDLDDVFDPDPSATGKMSTRWGGFLDRLDEFDASFFGISPREAPFVDPRQRLALEIAWEALEAAGIPADAVAGTRTGVFVATLANDYDQILFADLARAGVYSGAGTANSIVANRLSYFFDLHGPSITVDTACSGSLVAMHLACESLRSGECTLALAGGVNVNLLPKSNVFFSKAGALAADGRCKTFDAHADGMVRSDGAGLVVLKRLSQALHDGDPIVAVIRGSAVNHDGRSNGIMAPNGEAQKTVLDEAYRRARVDPADVQYVEAHGTGTRLGDPIEVEALEAVLGRGRPAGRACALGSVKTNIGHTEAAAGVAGVIKTALMMQHRQMPPTVHVVELNPLIRFDRLPFTVPRALVDWPSPAGRRIAGVSSFGFGGTNAHVVLEEAPPATSPVAAAIGLPFVLALSARTPAALQAVATRFAERVTTGADDLAEICRTAATRRAHLPCRLAAIGDTRDALLAKLARLAASPDAGGERRTGPVAFVFSGQGSHWPSMGRRLAEAEPVFRASLEACDRLFARRAGWSLIEELGRRGTDSRLNATDYAQPAVFAIQIALASLWRSWGVTPDVVVGHSLGEAAAACAAGALTLEDAVEVVFHRSVLMQRVAGLGATGVVGLPIEQVRQVVDGDSALAIAGTNSPASCVIAGDAQSVARALERFTAQGAFARLIPGVNVAFHSPQMDALRGELVSRLSAIAPAASAVPMLSTVTGAEIDGAALGADYWGRNLREPFEFAGATEQLIARGCAAIVEVSPHPLLCSAMVQTLRHHQTPAIPILPSMRRDEPELAILRTTLGALYEQGRAINWAGVFGPGRPVALPSYPWERRRYWWDQLPSSPQDERPAATAHAHALLGERIEPAAITEKDGAPSSLWEFACSADRPSYLADHTILGDVMLPGAVVLELASAAGQQLFGSRAVAVVDVVFDRALRLEPGADRRAQLVLHPHGDAAEFGFYSRRRLAGAPSEPWVGYVRGHLRPIDPTTTSIGDARFDEADAREGDAIAVPSHYDALRSIGLEYGPRFQSLVQLFTSDGEATGLLRLPAVLADRGYLVHPVLIDGAFQVVAAAAALRDYGYIPSGVREWVVARSPGRQAWCRARVRGASGDETLSADFELFDESGGVCAYAAGVTLRRTIRTHDAAVFESLVEERWEPREVRAPIVERPVAAPAANARTWVLLADASGVADALALELTRQGDRVRLVPRGNAVTRLFEEMGQGCDGVVDLWSLDSGVATLLHLVQTVSRLAPRARLWVVTRGAEPAPGASIDVEQAPLAGMMLTIAQEHPELRCTLVDLDPDTGDRVAALAAELQADGREPRVAWRGGVRYVARLARVRVPQSPGADVTRIRPDATYLITGGLGALGLHAAETLGRDGARHLVLAGRHQPSAAADAAIRRLEADGVRVVTARVDVSRRDEVDTLFDGLLSCVPPLRGVIHAAGVLDDGLLGDQTPERFEAVMAPKVQGTWNLHERTAMLALDFFVCYSSIASLVGSPGQSSYAAANRFMDAVARYRRGLGLPALTINWGPWAEAGMAAAPAVRNRLTARGLTAIDPREASALLSILIRRDIGGQIGVLPVDWPRFLAPFGLDVPPLFDAFAARPDSVSRALLPERLRTVSVHERAALMRSCVASELAVVFGFASAADVGTDQTFFDLGMDSLMAIELRNRLQSALRTTLPATIAFDHPTVEALGDHLAAHLFPNLAPSRV